MTSNLDFGDSPFNGKDQRSHNSNVIHSQRRETKHRSVSSAVAARNSHPKPQTLAEIVFGKSAAPCAGGGAPAIENLAGALSVQQGDAVRVSDAGNTVVVGIGACLKRSSEWGDKDLSPSH